MTSRERKAIAGHIAKLEPAESCVRAKTHLIRYGERASEAVYQACFHASTNARWCAAWVLAKIGDPRAYRVYLALINDPDPNVAFHSLWDFGMLRFPDSVQHIIEKARDSESSAAYALAAYGPDALEPVEKLLYDESVAARTCAIYVIERLAPRRALELLPAFLNDPEPEVAECAKERYEIALETLAEQNTKKKARR